MEKTAGRSSPALVQPSLKVGPANDPLEREAEAMAERVVAMEAPVLEPADNIAADGAVAAAGSPDIPPGPPVDLPGAPPAEPPPQSGAGRGSVRAVRGEGAIVGAEGGAAPPDVARRVARPGGGRPLPEPVRAFMEPRFGRDFSSVRIHDAPEDRRAAHRIGARAFTHGRHIWMGPGESAGDRKLLAHELTHVVQQTSPGPARLVGKSVDSADFASARSKVRAELRKHSGERPDGPVVANPSVHETPGVDPIGSFMEASARQAREDISERVRTSLRQVQQRSGLRLGRQVLNGAVPLAVHEQPQAGVQRDEPKYVIVPAAGTREPLAAYAGLRDRLSPSQWNALSAAARRRSEQVLTGAPSTEKNELVKTELTVPLDVLFEPAITESRRSGKDLWLPDLFALAMAGGPSATAAMGQRLQDEILFEWLQENAGILSEEVTIAVVDPAGKGKGATSLLAYTFRGRPVAPVNGLLTLAAVDKVIGGKAEARLASMKWQLMALGEAIERAGKAKAMIAAGRDVAAQKHDKIAAQSLDQIDAAMRAGLSELEAVTAPPFSELVQPIAVELKTFLDGDFAKFRSDYAKWRNDNPRTKGSQEVLLGAFSESVKAHEKIKKGPWWQSFGSYLGGGDERAAQLLMAGSQEIVTGGASSQERHLGLAYDQGLISYDSWSKGVAAAEQRGWIFAGLNTALAFATLGIGLCIGPSLSFGGTVLFGAGTGFVTTTVPMLGSNWYTSNTSFADPLLQHWWQSGSYSKKDILVSGLVGAGIGGAFPIAERVLSGLKGAGAPVLQSLTKPGKLPKGVVAKTVERGVVELTIASENLTIHLTEKGYQVFGPAGNNAGVILEEGAWAAEIAGGQGFGVRFDLLNPDFPTTLGFGKTGWGMVSPKSSLPVQSGFWPEFAPMQGGASAQTGAEMSPLLRDPMAGATLSSITRTDEALILSAMYLPPGGSGPSSNPVVSTLLPPPKFWPGSLFPEAGWYLPDAELASTKSMIVTFGKLVEQHGTDVLTYLGRFNVWVKHPDGYAPYFNVLSKNNLPKLKLTAYGAELSNILFDVEGTIKSAVIIPGQSYSGSRYYSMTVEEMTDPKTGLVMARSHVIGHAQTKPEKAGGVSSTSDPLNFVAHPVKYNEWMRNQLEQKLKREGLAYSAHNINTDKTRLTTGGYMIPEAEIFVQYGPNGQAIKAWEFPLEDPYFYDNLEGSFKDVLPQFEIGLNDIPKSLIIK